MKLAVISDIHANLAALKAVLADIKSLRISEVWNLGDLIGYGPFPNEVIALLKAAKVKSILGNYDLKVLNFAPHQKEWKGQKDPAKFFSFAWTDRSLSVATRTYLANLPERRTLHFGNKSFLLLHASPQRNDEALLPTTPEERFLELAKGIKADVILCGHSHRYFSRAAAGIWFVNPGSVGRPFDQDPRASYAVVELNDKGMVFINRRVAYPVEETTGRMKELGFPVALVDSITLGKSLDDFKPDLSQRDDSAVIAQVLAMAQACHYEKEHSRQVTALALQLFDQLRELHGLGEDERLWLQIAGLLHDIGWVEGRQSHHKTGRDIILTAQDFPLDRPFQVIIALLVRYHRRSLPEEDHRYFRDLTAEEKTKVRKLAALLRIADGLDRGHESLVQEIVCRATPEHVVIQVRSSGPSDAEKKAAGEKADLFIAVFGKTICFE